MNRFDFSPYRRSTVGFDRLFDLLENQARNSGDNYPPFNIERRGEDSYRITLAVAGFRPEDLDITAQQNLLTIQGRKREETPDGDMLHVGTANRGFDVLLICADTPSKNVASSSRTSCAWIKPTWRTACW